MGRSPQLLGGADNLNVISTFEGRKRKKLDFRFLRHCKNQPFVGTEPIIIIIVVIAVNAKGHASVETGGKAPQKGEFYFDHLPAVGQIVEFGEYEQDGITANDKEPIKWHVVAADKD